MPTATNPCVSYPSAAAFQWTAGPYQPPHAKVGAKLHDEMLGDVTVEGVTDAPVSWPATTFRGRLIPILCGDLVRAVCEEVEVVTAHYWGVTKYVVNQWRKALADGETSLTVVHAVLAVKRHDPEWRAKWGYRE